jgi:hypothetical protein
MSSSAFSDVEDRIDPSLTGKNKTEEDWTAQMLVHHARVPEHVLDAEGYPTRHEFNPEDAHTYPTTKELPSGEKIHLHQDVRELDDDDDFGDFGAVEGEVNEEETIWTIVDLLDGTATITVVGDWSQRRDVPFEELTEKYEPLTLTDGQPSWGY